MSESGHAWVQPQFTATLILERHVTLSFRQLQDEIKRLAPDQDLGDWTGPIADPGADLGVEMLTLGDEKLSVLVVDAPAPAAILRPGPFPTFLWPNAEQEAEHHKAHIIVLGLENPIDRTAALAKARAVTLVTVAIARLVPALGVSWADSANLVRAAGLLKMTETIGRPGANAVPFWVRIMLANGESGPRGEATLKAGTTGLRIFGLRELEYAATPLEPGDLVQQAWSTAEYLLTSGKRLADGETIGVEGQTRFCISHADTGEFVAFPIARLTATNDV
ncbi:DUF4261 domain-containing protein [Bradyrhizobium sp. HKCCYLS3077]|uniref:DUF4261 domain-containing protein n=1 Tax=Bradyrhizobium sp. HKCCYLS3077 TaxID=3420761 RepID=UPI003EB7F8F7